MPIIREIVYGTARQGVPLQQLCRAMGLTPGDLTENERRVPFDQAIQVWSIALRSSKDPLLGLHLGESTNATIMGAVGHLMQVSRTLEEAFQEVIRFGRLATDMFDYRMSSSQGDITLTFAPTPAWKEESPATARQAVDQAMAGTLCVFFYLAGQRVNPQRVELERNRPSDRLEYQRVFGVMPVFSGSANRLVFTNAQLRAPVLSYDRSIGKMLTSLLQERSMADVNLAARVRNSVVADFGGRVPSVEVMAAHLHFTPRTLQRKLRDEGTTYRELAAEIRVRTVRQMMKWRTMKMIEIARTVGYSDASAMRRAIRTWDKGNKKRS